MCVCVCVSVSVSVFVCVCVSVHAYVCLSICASMYSTCSFRCVGVQDMSMYTCAFCVYIVCTCFQMFTCLYVQGMYICMCVCVCVFVCFSMAVLKVYFMDLSCRRAKVLCAGVQCVPPGSFSLPSPCWSLI